MSMKFTNHNIKLESHTTILVSLKNKIYSGKVQKNCFLANYSEIEVLTNLSTMPRLRRGRGIFINTLKF